MPEGDVKMGNEFTTAVPLRLVSYLIPIRKAAVAFSGGADSGYLLYAAMKSGVEVRAYCASSQFQPRFELNDALRLAGELGANLDVITLDVLNNQAVASNAADRCYHCKRTILEAIMKKSRGDGYFTLMDGSNASDDAGDRPGMRALAELKVISPLRDVGITKAQIRELSREAGLFTWDKPAYACLATRVPTGVSLDAETLVKIENAENTLARMGFSDFRARLLGRAVKLQLPRDQISLAADRHEELLEAMSGWFDDVLLDLKPR